MLKVFSHNKVHPEECILEKPTIQRTEKPYGVIPDTFPRKYQVPYEILKSKLASLVVYNDDTQ